MNEMARPAAGGLRLGFGGYPAWFDLKPPWIVGLPPTPLLGSLDVVLPVDVRSQYLGGWSHGFEVAEQVAGGYLIRRLSDGSILPDVLGRDEVRSDGRERDVWGS